MNKPGLNCKLFPFASKGEWAGNFPAHLEERERARRKPHFFRVFGLDPGSWQTKMTLRVCH